MVQFGLHLQQNARPEWQHSYINYDILKQHIEQIADATDDQGTLDLLKRKFQLTLDGEILKVVRRVGWARGQGGGRRQGRAWHKAWRNGHLPRWYARTAAHMRSCQNLPDLPPDVRRSSFSSGA